MARALELVATFDQTIVGVWHLPLAKDTTFTVGAGSGATLSVRDARFALDPHPLVTISSGTYAVDATPEMYVANTSERRALKLGEVFVDIREVDAPAYLAWRKPFDWLAARPTAACGALALAMLALAYSVPPDAKTLSVDRMDLMKRMVTISMIPPVVPPAPKQSGDNGETATVGSGTGAPRAPKPEGRRGNPDPTVSHAPKREMIKGTADHREYALQAAHDRAKNIGIVGVLAQNEYSHIGSVFGGNRVLGTEAQDALGQITAATGGDSWGDATAGGNKGDGPGGGGKDTVPLSGGIGMCNGDHCDNRINGDGRKYADGKHGPNVGLPNMKHKVGETEVYKPVIHTTVGPSKELIRRVVRSHLAEVRFCYEKQLVTHPNLDGRLLVRFTIASTGRVIQANIEASTIPDPTVGVCVARQVNTWEFPMPAGAGLAVVSYPFSFRLSGTE